MSGERLAAQVYVPSMRRAIMATKNWYMLLQRSVDLWIMSSHAKFCSASTSSFKLFLVSRRTLASSSAACNWLALKGKSKGNWCPRRFRSTARKSSANSNIYLSLSSEMGLHLLMLQSESIIQKIAKQRRTAYSSGGILGP